MTTQPVQEMNSAPPASPGEIVEEFLRLREIVAEMKERANTLSLAIQRCAMEYEDLQENLFGGDPTVADVPDDPEEQQ